MPTNEQFVERWEGIVDVTGRLARASRNYRLGDIERTLKEQGARSVYEYIEDNALYPDEELYKELGAAVDEAAVKTQYTNLHRLAKQVLATLQEREEPEPEPEPEPDPEPVEEPEEVEETADEPEPVEEEPIPEAAQDDNEE